VKRLKKAASKRNYKNFFLNNIVWVLLILSIIFMGLFNAAFFKKTILSNILTQSAVLGVLTVGQAHALLIGEIDLSIVGTMAFSAGLGVTFMMKGLPWPLAILFIIFFGIVVGIVNGLLITKLKATALIETLAMGIILQGALMALTSGQTIIGFPEKFTWIGTTYVGGFSLLLIPLFIVFILAWFLWNKTTLGRSLFAVGGNADCAKVCGIEVDKVKIKAFLISGMCAGIAGYLLACYICAVTMTFGNGQDMYTLAAAVIGGVSLKGGIGRISGVLGGVLLITVIQVGLQTLGVSAYWTTLFSGLMIFIAVIFDSIKSRSLNMR